MAGTPNDVLKTMKDEGIEVVDVRFCDLPGLMQHFSVPAHELTEDVFEDGLGFDGSSIRGFQEIQESDMLLIPDPNTAVIDPFRQHPTLNINCFVRDPVTGRVVLARPALHRPEGRGLPEVDRHRRHRVLRARSRVLHLRLGALRPEPVLGLLLPRLGRRCVELGTRARARRLAEPRVQAAVQGGLLPGPADGPVPGPALRDGAPARSRSASRSRCSTTRSAPRARPRSTCASTSSRSWPTS